MIQWCTLINRFCGAKDQDGASHHGWDGKVSAEQSSAYQTTSSLRMGIEVTTVTLRWLYNTSIARIITVCHSQSMPWSVQNGWLWYEWLPYMMTWNLQELWIYCLGHAGISGKERVDSLASEAPITVTLGYNGYIVGNKGLLEWGIGEWNE